MYNPGFQAVEKSGITTYNGHQPDLYEPSSYGLPSYDPQAYQSSRHQSVKFPSFYGPPAPAAAAPIYMGR